MGYSLWGRKESDTTERLTQTHTLSLKGKERRDEHKTFKMVCLQMVWKTLFLVTTHF